MSRDEAIVNINQHLNFAIYQVNNIENSKSYREWHQVDVDAFNQAISDIKKMDEIERLLEAKEVPGGLLLAIREVVER